ncbi:MAG TPA: tRNA preQ1(34) S-adenosylmethionine ribosyltransferase-isomerase QueA [Candidatus Cybelea sp.]|nr:tRNA preQ1(34) S-adenosylmethionine ribosyltransferase-isomerase QueA [Candidatus Cybelea sp.]
MNTSDFDYELPPERIAQWPLAERDASRMLLVERNTGRWRDTYFRELPNLLRGDELIVMNNVQVIPARLFGHRKGIHAQRVGRHNPARGEFLRTEIELLLVRRLSCDRWQALVRPGRKVPTGEQITFGQGELQATVEARLAFGLRLVRFEASEGVDEALRRLGHVPLPPYIRREDEVIDRERYQTVYATQGTAVAAPTAGLHFTPEILKHLRERGTDMVEVTLDVGLGTFEPVRTESLEQHKIHSESYEISGQAAEAITRALSQGRPVLAIGTSVVRALEDAVPESGGRPVVAPGRRDATLFLYPGKPFRVVSQLLTNFHLPKSTLLALVAAFAGRKRVLAAYRHAVEADYRFYSYGDCMLIR